jgi:CheY-like chemotaxis protein
MKPRILVIEDNEQNMYLTTYLLEKHGYEVVQARTGAEGIELAQQVQPHLIILDIQLPLMDGYAVARALREHAALREVPIVAVTSCAMLGDRERILAMGCNGYLEKPINPDTFTSEIQNHLTVRSRQGVEHDNDPGRG